MIDYTDACFQVIRKVDVAAGVVTTVAGMRQVGGNIDGSLSTARFTYPSDVSLDLTRDPPLLLIVETGYHQVGTEHPLSQTEALITDYDRFAASTPSETRWSAQRGSVQEDRPSTASGNLHGCTIRTALLVRQQTYFLKRSRNLCRVRLAIEQGISHFLRGGLQQSSGGHSHQRFRCNLSSPHEPTPFLTRTNTIRFVSFGPAQQAQPQLQ